MINQEIRVDQTLGLCNAGWARLFTCYCTITRPKIYLFFSGIEKQNKATRPMSISNCFLFNMPTTVPTVRKTQSTPM